MSSAPASAVTEANYEFAARVDALRCHSTKAPRTVVTDARREQQRWYLEELAATRVLDDRHALDAMPDPSVSSRTAKTNREVARSLESLPDAAARCAARYMTSWRDADQGMEPQGTERLVGDPDLPDGLRVITVTKRERAGPAP